MSKLVARLLAALALVLLAPSALADPADIAAASRSVVRVVILETDGTRASIVGHGTGFAVAPNLVVTNAHVVEQLQEDDSLLVGVVPPQGRAGVQASLVATSPRNDLALLRIDGKGMLPAATLYPGAVQDSAEVFAVGYPGNVDMAQGLSMADLVTPQAAVKTRGYVSAGRSSKQFDTILHTAPLGSGNSGGPLLDSCGRVVGVNSFGTVSDNGTDSSFFFAISMRELAAFLRQAGVEPHTSGLPCTSIADLDRADATRAMGEQARAAAEQQGRLEARQRAQDKARRDAELAVLAERDNGLALAVLLLVGALAMGGWAFLQGQRGEARAMKVFGGLAGALVLGAVVAWLLRPSLASIDERAQDMLAEPEASASASAEPLPARAAGTGPMTCVIDTSRSRVTVSDITDVPLDWSADGCVNGRTQYGLAEDGWSRVLVPNGEDTISVTHYDPASRGYTVERFLMGLDAMTQARAARSKIVAPACGAGEDAARQFGAAQRAITALLPAEPNERMRYNCQPTP
ncbi:S1C family serine protease [Novosphingobium huizhouense]|uniref:S1C family serine protease n=1 Tax=Novosphingobium huizhouense TaxID=2866625 RepID=UPI001CD8F48E|nr:serine protease [Novosphingobium huizhouense]